MRQGIIENRGENFNVTPEGSAFFGRLHIQLDEIRLKKRAFARSCLDLSERKPHLAGALGSALLDKFLELNWIEQIPSTRALRVTKLGQKELTRLKLINKSFPE